MQAGHPRDGLAAFSAALVASESLGRDYDPTGRAVIRYCLGIVNVQLGRLDVATELFADGVEEHTLAGSDAGVVRSLSGLGTISYLQGRYQEALDFHGRGLKLARTAGRGQAEATQLNNVATIHLRLEQYGTAAVNYRDSIELFMATGNMSYPDPMPLVGLSRCLAGLGRWEEAMAEAVRAQHIAEEHGDLDAQAEAVDTIALINRHFGRHADALEDLDHEVASRRGTCPPSLMAQLLNALGETQRVAGSALLALDSHVESLRIATEIGDRYERARALAGLGDTHAALGGHERARRYWHDAAREFTEMELPEGQRLHQRLVQN
jgi:tetratricopeptide (TPR) repeat protein